jgi:cupin 2 domain-containing protein
VVNPLENIFGPFENSAGEEFTESLIRAEGFRLERIVSTGQRTPEGEWLDQDLDEWVVMLTGNARLGFEDSGEIVDLKPGDHLCIPAHRRHCVEWTDPSEATVWLAIHYAVMDNSGD